MDAFQELNSTRLVLRQIKSSDVQRIYGIFRDDVVTRHCSVAPFESRQQAHDWIEVMHRRFQKRQGVRWAIEYKDQLIGTCGFLWEECNRSATLGYDLMPGYWRKGFITEACETIIREAFKGSIASFVINRIEVVAYPDNAASIRVLEKLGFRHEGQLRQWAYWKNAYHNLFLYSKNLSDLDYRYDEQFASDTK